MEISQNFVAFSEYMNFNNFNYNINAYHERTQKHLGTADYRGQLPTTILTIQMLNVKFGMENGYEKQVTLSNISKDQNFRKRL